MTMRSLGSLDYWRNYFRGGRSDIFDIINGAIMVAASDRPKELKLRRCAIAERLYSCCCLNVSDGVVFEVGASKDSKINNNCCGDDDHGNGNGNGEMNMHNRVSNYSYEEAAALTEEIEQESQCIQEVLRIRDIFLNNKEWSDAVLFESLRRLQLMDLTVDLLKATEIGKVVNPLRKHRSKDISQFSRTLINDWKTKVDEWVKGGTLISEGTPNSINPSVVDEEEGLPVPPMDEWALFASQTVSMELSQLFDGMDDDGNPLQSGEFIKNRDDVKRPCLKNSQNIAKRKFEAPNEANIVTKGCKSQQENKNVATVRLNNKPVAANSVPSRPPKPNMQQKGNIEPNMLQKKPQVSQLDKFKCLDDAAVHVKLEATKRKLQERYQQAENVKRQKTIQVIELRDLPKQGPSHRNPVVKPGNHKNQWVHKRR